MKQFGGFKVAGVLMKRLEVGCTILLSKISQAELEMNCVS